MKWCGYFYSKIFEHSQIRNFNEGINILEGLQKILWKTEVSEKHQFQPNKWN